MYYSVRHDQKSNFHTDDAEQMEGKDGTREMTAVGKQMEMEVREELWRKCAMPAACTAVSCKTISAGGTWKNFCASDCAEKGGKALIYGHRLTSGGGRSGGRSGAPSARQERRAGGRQ